MRKRALLPFVVAAISAVALVPCLTAPPDPLGTGEHERPLLPRPELLLALGAGYRQNVADYFWLVTLYHTGVARTAEEYRDLYYYLDLITDVDPDFKYAYGFGGTMIPFNRGRERWVNAEEAIRIVEKGRRRFPEDSWLRLVHAYNLSFFQRRYREAADILAGVAWAPGMPEYLPSLVTRLYAAAGDPQTGVVFAQSMAEATTDPNARAFFEKRVAELQAEAVLQRVDDAAAAYRSRTAHAPATVSELVSAGDLPTVPADPLGGEIYLGADGRARSTLSDDRLKVYDPRDNYR